MNARRLLTGFLLVVGLFFLASWVTTHRWGRDVDVLDVKEGDRAFKAKRDATGVWHIEAEKPDDLWFAVGCVHLWDREFQTEMLRKLAVGESASWFGEKMLGQDRLFRKSSHLARWEWNQLRRKEGGPLVSALQSYVAGRAACAKKEPARIPVEYRIFQIRREDIKPWEPWEVLAVTRLHAWEFSYDFLNEARASAMERELGPLAKTLVPGEPPVSGETLYRQPLLMKSVKPHLGGGSGKLPPVFAPTESSSALFDLAPRATFTANLDVKSRATPMYGPVLGAELGASNVWIASSPAEKLDPTLCNDTHLSFLWPAPLYPVAFKMGELRGEGFTLPGAPPLAVGRVHHGEETFAWGVTIANYADTQDLVRLEPATLAKARIVEEKFQVRDLKTWKLSEVSFRDEWTPYGPRVDEVIDWKGAAPSDVPLALDALAFRPMRSPLGFFLRRTLYGGRDLRRDLATEWEFPSVNFTWLERDAHGQRTGGHAVTGAIFDRKRKELGTISEAEAKTRGVSWPASRPYAETSLEDSKPFLLVSANQSTFMPPLGERLGWEWNDRGRVRRLLDLLGKVPSDVQSAQTDVTSISILNFLRAAREHVGADRLCGDGPAQFMNSCFEVLASLDSWQGNMAAGRWEPTLAALWYSRFKLALWPAKILDVKPQLEPVFAEWARGNGATRAVSAVLTDAKARAEWEKAAGATVADRLAESFGQSLNELVEGLGPVTSSWGWGKVHQLDWVHPFRFIPGSTGDTLRRALFGPPLAVSGAADSPARANFAWKPSRPLEFPSQHGAVMRFCTTLPKQGASPMRWTSVTGVSGHPLSKWAWPLARDYYFEGKLFDVPEL